MTRILIPIMSSVPKRQTFKNARVALSKFNAHRQTIESVTSETIIDWLAEEARLRLELCMAFFEDTKAYNRIDNCLLLNTRQGAEVIRKQVERAGVQP